MTDAIRSAMIGHARAEAPRECCGVIATDGDGQPRKVYTARNVSQSMTGYVVHPDDVMRISIDVRKHGWFIGMIYHSHPSGQAYPSETDIELAPLSFALYAIIADEDVRVFTIKDKAAQEVPWPWT